MSRWLVGPSLVGILVAAPFLPAQAIRTLSGHSGAITAVVFRPDGEHLASASFDHTVRVWEAGTGRAVCTCRGHLDKVTALAYSPDGTLLASASLDHTLRLWDARAGGRRRLLPTGERAVQALAFTPDGRQLVCAGDSGTVEVIDLTRGEAVRRFTLSKLPLYAVALSADGDRLAAGGQDGRVHVIRLATGEVLHTLPAGGGGVYSLTFAPAGDRLAAGEDEGVREWSLPAGNPLACHTDHQAPVYQVSYSADGRRVVSTGIDGQVFVRDARTGGILHSHRFPGKTLCAAIAPDGRHVGTGTARAECFLLALPRRTW